MPGYVTKPFTMYFTIAKQLLTPLGLHFFLAFQEVIFYSYCSYYQTFAKVVMETEDEGPRLDRSSATESSKTAKQNNILVYGKPTGETLHGNLKELVDIMKSMTETFGPFLLQNFSLMLLYWLLHLYFVCFTVILTVRTFGVLFSPFWMAMRCLQFASGLLIVR